MIKNMQQWQVQKRDVSREFLLRLHAPWGENQLLLEVHEEFWCGKE